MEVTPLLERQIARWQRQDKAGELPESVYDFIAQDASGLERRQVINLARFSRVISPEGKLRPYSEFKKDWKYERSRFGFGSECQLCGNHHIREECILVDQDHEEEDSEQWTRIIAGNICVYRYLEIEVDGKVLDGAEKEKFLKDKTKEARELFKREQFAQSHPLIMKDLSRFEPMMTERFGAKYRNPQWGSLHASMTKRMLTNGFPGPKLLRKWERFMERGEADLEAWKHEKEEQEKRRAKVAEESRRYYQRAAVEAQRRRDQWNEEAQEWLATATKLDAELNDWERQMVGRVFQRIKLTGSKTLRAGMGRFFDEIKYRVQVLEGEIEIQENALVRDIEMWINSRWANDWERSFLRSIKTKAVMGQSLTEKQEKALDKIRQKAARLV